MWLDALLEETSATGDIEDWMREPPVLSLGFLSRQEIEILKPWHWRVLEFWSISIETHQKTAHGAHHVSQIAAASPAASNSLPSARHLKALFFGVWLSDTRSTVRAAPFLKQYYIFISLLIGYGLWNMISVNTGNQNIWLRWPRWKYVTWWLIVLNFYQLIFLFFSLLRPTTFHTLMQLIFSVMTAIIALWFILNSSFIQYIHKKN